MGHWRYLVFFFFNFHGIITIVFKILGYDGMKNLSTVEMYNPETNEWSFVAPMESHEGGVGVGVIPMEE